MKATIITRYRKDKTTYSICFETNNIGYHLYLSNIDDEAFIEEFIDNWKGELEKETILID